MDRSIFEDLFVLELANNHWGRLDRGLKIIRDFGEVVRRDAVRAAMKLQFRDVQSFIHPSHRDRDDVRYIKKVNGTDSHSGLGSAYVAAWHKASSDTAFQQAQDEQFASGTWDYGAGSPNEGGHAVPAFGRNKGRGGLVSWAKHLWFTPAFYTHLADEAYAIVFPEELKNGKTERGMDLSQLNAALNAL